MKLVLKVRNVSYMVDESLIAYLEGQLKTKVPNLAEMKDLQNLLREVFAYTEKAHPFDEEEVDTLIDAIDTCKILDPACGSGAFPMGILHKLVFILGKLDPHNERWKQRQIVKAEQIPDVSAREIAVGAIEKDFETNDLDYGRKLYLIENCIYGADIQPIAIQISKLRFFVSLICDQRTNKNKAQNCGVRPHRHFAAQRRRDKLALQKRDVEIRKEIAGVLAGGGMSGEAAHRLAAWDPYDQNTSAPFFDPEWMYGIQEGFHVVIGNPPYVQIQKFSGKQEQKDWEKQRFLTFVKTGDIYCLFYERGNMLLRDNGILAFITSNKWMRANYGKKTRKYLSGKTNPQVLIDFGGYNVFESATVDTNILYKFFYGEFNLPVDGENLLIYGENGSGKSSIYKALELLTKEKIENLGQSRNIFSESGDIEVEFGFTNGTEFTITEDTEVLPDYVDFLKALSVFKPMLDYKKLLRVHYVERTVQATALLILLIISLTFMQHCIVFSEIVKLFWRQYRK